MKKIVGIAIMFLVMAISPAFGQTGGSGTGNGAESDGGIMQKGDHPGIGSRYSTHMMINMQSMMNEMTGLMQQITGAMNRGNMNAETRKQMGTVMGEMSGQMYTISRQMKTGVSEDQAEQMRRNLNAMKQRMDEITQNTAVTE